MKIENLLVSRYCIEYRKTPLLWGGRSGCYGYPAAILLFIIADTIGSYILGGNNEHHFEILNDHRYYDLKLSKHEINEIYRNYRSLLVHNGALPIDRLLAIGYVFSPVLDKTTNGGLVLNLIPFWNKTYCCVGHFVNTVSLNNSHRAEIIQCIPKPFS